MADSAVSPRGRRAGPQMRPPRADSPARWDRPVRSCPSRPWVPGLQETLGSVRPGSRHPAGRRSSWSRVSVARGPSAEAGPSPGPRSEPARPFGLAAAHALQVSWPAFDLTRRGAWPGAPSRRLVKPWPAAGDPLVRGLMWPALPRPGMGDLAGNGCRLGGGRRPPDVLVLGPSANWSWAGRALGGRRLQPSV